MSKLSPAKRLEWKKRICCQRESGLSIERWCRENKIAPHLFYYWKARLFPVIQKAAFIEVQDIPKWTQNLGLGNVKANEIRRSQPT